MILDSGEARIYSVDRNEEAPPPNTVTLTEKARYPFGDKTVGSTRFFRAAEVGQKIDRIIEIWRDPSVTTRDICAIDGVWYLIIQTQQGENEDGLNVTRLSLQWTDGAMWEVALHGDDTA